MFDTRNRLWIPLLLFALVWGAVAGPAELRIRLVPEVSLEVEPGDRVSVQASDHIEDGWTSLFDQLATTPSVRVYDGAANGLRFYRSVVTHQVGTAGMAFVPGGEFVMGSESEGIGSRRVQVSGFRIDRFEVSKALWDEVRLWGSTNGYEIHPGLVGGTNHPITGVNWFDVAKWNNARSEMAGLRPAYYTDPNFNEVYRHGQTSPFVLLGAGFRVPTAAEWEKAARAGSTGLPFSWPDLGDISPARANYRDSGLARTVPVGTYQANSLGIFDMTGNVTEWCLNRVGFETNQNGSDPSGPILGTLFETRGGSFDSLGRVFKLRT